MAMYNPPHPGEFITSVYLEPNGISGRVLADKLGVAAAAPPNCVFPLTCRVLVNPTTG
jgi:plasmid maintenance system antidote protein VapI